MKNKFLSRILFLCLFLIISGNAWAQDVSVPDYDVLNASIMRPDRDTRLKWKEDYQNAPRAFIDENINERIVQSQERFVGTSISLLNYLEYTPSERDQGYCGNCWVWAGTGVMEIALSVQNGIKDRFSIQYLNSCKGTGCNHACCGGNLTGFVSWYSGQGLSIPWDNTNAFYQDYGFGGDCKRCIGCISSIGCGSISTDPNYPITSIQDQTITTRGVNQSTAISNIKNILNQNKAVWFAYWLATNADWAAFINFWQSQPESTLWNPDTYCGHEWIDGQGGGHAVLIVGYNDDDVNPTNHYWIVLNSWGTTSGRPTGLFRMKMYMNYECILYDPYPYWFYNVEFKTISMTYNAGGCTYSLLPTSDSFSASGGTGSVSVTTQSECNWTAISNDSWITVTSGSSGTGNGTVNYSVAANSGASRIGTITIAGKTFTVNQSAPAPTITVTIPDGGETWPPGTTQTIRWTYTGDPGSYVKIVLQKNGVFNRNITKSTSIGSGGNGSYNWSILSTQTPGTDYKVRIVSTADSSYQDISNNYFTIGSTTTYSISGKVATSGGTGISSVTMTLSGAGTGTTTTDSSGNYSFSGLSNGSYTVTPNKTGYTFTPPNKSVNISGANVTGQDFTGTPSGTTYSISGTVTSGGSPLSGVTMTLSGAGTGTTTTDGSGNYSFTGLTNGSYTVTPSKTGYTFTPPNKSVNISGANMTGQDFTGTPTGITYSISGTVTKSTGSFSGVTMTLSGDASRTTTTDGSGNYSFTNLANGSYTVTPSKTGCSFTPSSRGVTISGANVTGQNFTAGKCK